MGRRHFKDGEDNTGMEEDGGKEMMREKGDKQDKSNNIWKETSK